MEDGQPTAPPTAEELKRWYTPQEALRRAAAHLGEKFAPEGIWNRVRAGIIGMASSSASQHRDNDPVTPYRTPQVLPAWFFRTHKEIPDKLWSGDFFFGFEEPPPEAETLGLAAVMADPELRYKFKFVYTEAFGVRFNPEDIDREFPPTAEELTAKAEETAKPRIGDDPLAAWAELFKRLYPGADQDFALSSARGMFPDKHVSRDRVRALIPARRPGRPKIE